MKKQELLWAARIMYDLQEYCKYVDCDECSLIAEDTTFGSKKAPANWGITLADIERLERKEDLDIEKAHCPQYKRKQVPHD